jgi:hypothetical protein
MRTVALWLAAMACLAAGSPGGVADAFTWTGLIDTHWDHPRNWTCGGAGGTHYWPSDPADAVEFPSPPQPAGPWQVTLATADILNGEIFWSMAMAGDPLAPPLVRVSDRVRVYNVGMQDIDLTITGAGLFVGEYLPSGRGLQPAAARACGPAAGPDSFGPAPFVFIAADGTWDVPANWDQGAVPGQPDWAIIPAGRTCRIEQHDEAIRRLDIAGLLDILNRTLTIDAAGSGGLNVGGALTFRGYASLRLASDLVARGGGVVCALAPDQGVIDAFLAEPAPQYVAQLHLAGLTLSGNVTILAHVLNEGLLLVDEPGELRLGHLAPGPPFAIYQGGGTCRVAHADARIVFGRVQPGSEFNAQGWFELAAGTIHLTSHTAGWTCGSSRPTIRMTGGLLDLDCEFKTQGDLDFRGGRIAVAPGQEAIFSHH